MRTLTALLLLLATGCGMKTTSDYLRETKEQGARAYRVGISASANPHIDNRLYAEQWFLGYLEEAELHKQTTVE